MYNIDIDLDNADWIKHVEKARKDVRLSKARVYISDHSEAPEGKDVKEGKRGGLYYETEPTRPYRARPDVNRETGEESPNEFVIQPPSKPVAEMTMEEFFDTAIWHGTGETIEGNLKGGAYDEILWTAETPDISQTYIPSRPSHQYSLPGPDDWGWDSNVTLREIHLTPQNVETEPLMRVLKEMGYWYHDFEWDRSSYPNPSSYVLTQPDGSPLPQVEHEEGGMKWTEQKSPTWGDVVTHLHEKYGYPMPAKDDFRFDLKLFVDRETGDILPGDSPSTGELYALFAKEPLKIYDLASGTEGDLMEPQYHALGLFRKLAERGYDGVTINDFLQSKTWGDVGHRSIGLFRSAWDKLEAYSAPAQKYDYDEDEGPNEEITPEAMQLYRDITRGADLDKAVGGGTVGQAGGDIVDQARFGSEASEEHSSTQKDKEVEVRRGPGIFAKSVGPKVNTYWMLDSEGHAISRVVAKNDEEADRKFREQQ